MKSRKYEQIKTRIGNMGEGMCNTPYFDLEQVEPSKDGLCQFCGKPMGDEVGDTHKACEDYENAK